MVEAQMPEVADMLEAAIYTALTAHRGQVDKGVTAMNRLGCCLIYPLAVVGTQGRLCDACMDDQRWGY